MGEIKNMPLPVRCHTVDEVIAAAKQQNLDNIVVLSETDEGMLVIHAGNDGPLTAAQIVWRCEYAKHIIIEGTPRHQR